MDESNTPSLGDGRSIRCTQMNTCRGYGEHIQALSPERLLTTLDDLVPPKRQLDPGFRPPPQPPLQLARGP